jgi:GTPase SAR1 family protein
MILGYLSHEMARDNIEVQLWDTPALRAVSGHPPRFESDCHPLRMCRSLAITIKAPVTHRELGMAIWDTAGQEKSHASFDLTNLTSCVHID